MKRLVLRLALLVFISVLYSSAFAYDFSAVCESGQTLYYNITSDTEPYTVEVTSEFGAETMTDFGFVNYSTYPTGTLKIPSSVTNGDITYSVTRIGDFAFFDCMDLTGELEIPNSVTSIGRLAFYICWNLTSVTIPNSVITIDVSAFHHCDGLTSLTIPNSVTSIGDGAFVICTGLESIVVDSDNPVYDSRNDCNAIIETATNTLIQGCKNTEIPNSVTSIGGGAFTDCVGLSSITIPNSVISIGNNAFWECHDLTSVTIGSSVSSIGQSAFEYCDNLDTIYILAENPPSIGSITFTNQTYDVPLIVPCGSVATYRNAEYWSDFTNIQSECNYTLSANSSDTNLGIVSGEGTYIEGSFATIEAFANEGYAFLEWNDGNADNPRTIEIISDTTFVATFAVAHTITIESSDSEMGYVTGSGIYAEGAEVEITAVPNEGYRFDHWVDVDNPSRDFNTDNPRTILVSADVTYMAVFTSLTGIDNSFESGISIYPNPASNELNILLNSLPEGRTMIEFHDVAGRLLMSQEITSTNARIDISSLPQGVYMCRIVNGDNIIARDRIMKE